jgi:hypothetical protein
LLAVSIRDVRLMAVGLLVAIFASPLVASPLPGPLPLAAWGIGATLTAYLVWASARAGSLQSPGSAIGPTAAAAAAAAAFIVGLNVKPVDPLEGPVVAQAAGLAILVLALVPMMGRDVLRLGLSIVLLTLGLVLLMNAWVGALLPLTHYTLVLLIVGIGGATSVLIGRADGADGDLDTTGSNS